MLTPGNHERDWPNTNDGAPCSGGAGGRPPGPASLQLPRSPWLSCGVTA